MKNKCLVRMMFATGLGLVLATAASSVVRAAIVSVTGQLTKIAPPPSVELGMLESNTTIFAFDERQCVALLAPLKVNISAPGFYGAGSTFTPGTIAAGTRVSSHFVHADRASTGLTILEGTLTTDAPILGLITANKSLTESDFLGALGTVYPTGSSGRAMQWKGGDWVNLDAGLHSVTVHTNTWRHSDQVRVITECRLPPPPPPPGGLEGCTPGYWKQEHHFDSWQVYSPTDSFNTVFGLAGPFPGTMTLVDALNLGGGGIYALARHAVAALLGSAHSAVDYGMTATEVIQKTKAAYVSGDATQIESTKNGFEALNEKGCPLS
jgi:hypothetical protein